jgi:FKBP-type peptidyl-prolyl cis-trans isomerase
MHKFLAFSLSTLLLISCNSSMKIEDITVGTGEEAEVGDTVEVNYTGTLTDGTVFDASERHGKTFSFTLGQGNVIEGWDEGVPGMQVGGKRKAYGDEGIPGVIPGGATLIFEVELVSIQ